jgi:hypothetical protein
VEGKRKHETVLRAVCCVVKKVQRCCFIVCRWLDGFIEPPPAGVGCAQLTALRNTIPNRYFALCKQDIYRASIKAKSSSM